MKTNFLSALTLYFLCLLVVTPCLQVQAQDYKHEVGIDISLLNLLRGNNQNNYYPYNGWYYNNVPDNAFDYPTVFYRHHKKNKKDKPIAYRFRIGTNLNFKKLETPSIKDLNQIRGIISSSNTGYLYDFSNFSIRLGRERQYRSGKFELLYGYDLYYRYQDNKSYQVTANWNYDNTLNDYYYSSHSILQSSKIYQFGISPIVGFKYFLLPRLCFSGEAKMDIGYEFIQQDRKEEHYESKENTYRSSILTLGKKGFNVNINPLYVVNMGYYF